MFSLKALQGQLMWLLDLNVAGEVVRLARSPITAVIGGVSYRYHRGLEWSGDFSEMMTAWSTSAQEYSVDLTLHLWPQADVPELVSRGHNPGTWTGRLMLYSAVDESVDVLINGHVRNPKWAARQEPLVCILENEARAADVGTMIPRSHRVKAWTFPSNDINYAGEYYPTVIGSPSGDISELAPLNRHPHSGSPVMIVARNSGSALATVGLIAGHRTYAGANGDTVTLTNYDRSDGSRRQEFTAAHGVDANGTEYTWVNFLENYPLPGGDEPWQTGDSIWCAWRENDDGVTVPTQTFAMLREDDSGDPMRGWGEVLMYAAKLSVGVDWNFARLDALAVRLNQLTFDGYIHPDPGDPITPYEWLQDNLLKDLPLSAHTSDGVYFRWWEYSGDVSGAACEIRATSDARNAWRKSMVSTTSYDAVTTDLIYDYFFNHRKDTAIISRERTGDPTGLRDVYQTGAFGADDEWPAATAGTVVLTDGTTTETYTALVPPGPNLAADFIADDFNDTILTGSPGTVWTSSTAVPSVLVTTELAGPEITMSSVDPERTPQVKITVAAALSALAHDHVEDAAGNQSLFFFDDLDAPTLDPWLAKSQIQYGTRKTTAISLPLVENRATAERIVAARAKAGAPQRATIVYDVLQYPGGTLEPGREITITDSDLGWTAKPGIVIEAAWTDDVTRSILVEVPLHGYGQTG